MHVTGACTTLYQLRLEAGGTVQDGTGQDGAGSTETRRKSSWEGLVALPPPPSLSMIP